MENGFSRLGTASHIETLLLDVVDAICVAEGSTTQENIDAVKKMLAGVVCEARKELPEAAELMDEALNDATKACMLARDDDGLRSARARLRSAKGTALYCVGLACLEVRRAFDAMPSPAEGGADGD